MDRHVSHFVVAIAAVSVCITSEKTSAQSYNALAKSFADASLIAHVAVTSAAPIKADTEPGTARFYVESKVVALVKAPAPQPPALALVVDLPRDSQGKAPKVKKAEWLIAARGVAGQVQLTAPPVVWTPDVEKRVRAIVTERSAAGAPGAIRRVSGAFYSPGNVPGESETQIFFDQAGGGRGSLSVLRRPGIGPAWSASFGEVASEGPPPAKDTLGWYRLVCGLPKTLPDTAIAELDETGRSAARADYGFVVTQLGRCDG
ncbi:hypothetical protein SPAN111604_06315 [Sphingomonas antarctica]|uniref:hypothetical protein n=1 Tax=Sphingomonas antarctica TaxID=2040274 RepID=UPI0039EACF89